MPIVWIFYASFLIGFFGGKNYGEHQAMKACAPVIQQTAEPTKGWIDDRSNAYTRPTVKSEEPPK